MKRRGRALKGRIRGGREIRGAHAFFRFRLNCSSCAKASLGWRSKMQFNAPVAYVTPISAYDVRGELVAKRNDGALDQATGFCDTSCKQMAAHPSKHAKRSDMECMRMALALQV